MTRAELEGITHELAFWKGFVRTERFLRDWCGRERTRELRAEVAAFILSRGPSRVLDVGSGPVSILRGTVPDGMLTAVDPLGGLYGLFVDYAALGIPAPKVHTAEALPWANEFDVVHMRNALDHTQNPGVAFQSLWGAVRPGGYLIVQGFEREGAHEGYAGFHQHDIYLRQFDLMWATAEGTRCMPCSLEHGRATEQAYVAPTEQGRPWFVWISRKPE